MYRMCAIQNKLTSRYFSCMFYVFSSERLSFGIETVEISKALYIRLLFQNVHNLRAIKKTIQSIFSVGNRQCFKDELRNGKSKM